MLRELHHGLIVSIYHPGCLRDLQPVLDPKGLVKQGKCMSELSEIFPYKKVVVLKCIGFQGIYNIPADDLSLVTQTGTSGEEYFLSVLVGIEFKRDLLP